MVHNFSSSADLYSPRFPWVDGLQVIYHYRDAIVSSRYVLVPPARVEDVLVVVSHPEVLAVKLKTTAETSGILFFGEAVAILASL
jgi:hypothetical protein